MFSAILTAFFAAVVAIGLTDVFKDYLTKLPPKAKTTVGIVVAIVVATMFGAVDNIFNGLGAFSSIFKLVFVDVVTVGFMQFGYKYCAKLASAVIEKLKEIVAK